MYCAVNGLEICMFISHEEGPGAYGADTVALVGGEGVSDLCSRTGRIGDEESGWASHTSVVLPRGRIDLGRPVLLVRWCHACLC